MIILSAISAFILASLASLLKEDQNIARQLDRSKQMLIAARIFTNEGYFQVEDEKGQFLPAKHAGQGYLVPAASVIQASDSDVKAVVSKRLKSFLVDSAGKRISLADAKVDEQQYVQAHERGGYAHLPQKLAYEIVDNPSSDGTMSTKTTGYLFHVTGMGLWDVISGYLALKTDGNTVIGISWYDQKETPGLGANIIDTSWQKQFPGKSVFQPASNGETDPKVAPLGLTVVRGKVNEVLGDVPKAKNSVDGMAGATLTGNGVNKAYKDTLAPYRPFLLSLYDAYQQGEKR
ncbi:MAG: nqrC [Chlamydiales bacterium]|jgi:Na+-transporting NADH:ubiquinone oxidoreductase subunit C|nr:nqrC [Chlamydiales bacterium]